MKLWKIILLIFLISLIIWAIYVYFSFNAKYPTNYKIYRGYNDFTPEELKNLTFKVYNNLSIPLLPKNSSIRQDLYNP